MDKQYHIGSVYTAPTETIKFDQESIHYNRRYTNEEFAAIRASIQEIGQQEPISINSETGLCEDGYTRTQICKELGIDILCKVVNGKLSKQIRRDLYRITDVGRDYSTAQKAVMAYKYIQLTGEKPDIAAKKHKINVRSLHPVIAIAGLGKTEILEELLETGQWDGMKDVRKIANLLRKTNEIVEVEESTTPRIDYTKLINTAQGIEHFWKVKNLVDNSRHELNLLLADYMNMKYKLVNGEENELHD